MWRIADGEPPAVRKARTVVHQAGTDLIVIAIFTQLDLQHGGPGSVEALEDEMGIIISHRDRIRIEVEARPIVRLVDWTVISYKDSVVVIDQCLESKIADQFRCRTYA